MFGCDREFTTSNYLDMVPHTQCPHTPPAPRSAHQGPQRTATAATAAIWRKHCSHVTHIVIIPAEGWGSLEVANKQVEAIYVRPKSLSNVSPRGPIVSITVYGLNRITDYKHSTEHPNIDVINGSLCVPGFPALQTHQHYDQLGVLDDVSLCVYQ
jgi:hypothetical protein